MLIIIFGESCTGKSTLADALSERAGAQVYSGKDYLRLAKSEGEARALFQKQLKGAAEGTGDLIYVIAEPELLSLVPEGGVRVLVTAELDQIKTRFAARMGATLPSPVAAMLGPGGGGRGAVTPLRAQNHPRGPPRAGRDAALTGGRHAGAEARLL